MIIGFLVPGGFNFFKLNTSKIILKNCLWVPHILDMDSKHFKVQNINNNFEKLSIRSLIWEGGSGQGACCSIGIISKWSVEELALIVIAVTNYGNEKT